jgi:hypothetical protein
MMSEVPLIAVILSSKEQSLEKADAAQKQTLSVPAAFKSGPIARVRLAAARRRQMVDPPGRYWLRP